ncbi:hypothetical protein M3Y97_00096200 [Aphelenchoides bicaudatus]|nr:hypothetical protein M3Y97_00096200 [Aphelenchoides bicaudatus]
MDSTLLYTDIWKPTSPAHFVNAPCSPLNSSRSPSTKTHFEFPQPAESKPQKQKTANTVEPKKPKNPISLSGLMKRKLFTKLFRVLTLKDVTGSKTYPRDYRARHQSAKRKRARSSQSSGLSNFEPMPTIFEETESDLASVQTTIHSNQYALYGNLLNQRQFVDTVA